MAPHALDNDSNASNWVSNSSKQQYNYAVDPDLTPSVINATGPNADERLREVFGNLVNHLHAFLRESKVTRVEYEAALRMVSSHETTYWLHPVDSTLVDTSRANDDRQARRDTTP